MVKLTSTGTADVQTLKLPSGTSAILLTCETTPGRITFDGSNPTGGHVFPKDGSLQLELLGIGTTLKWVSTAAANAVLQITPLV
jgi:hypothetical protein